MDYYCLILWNIIIPQDKLISAVFNISLLAEHKFLVVKKIGNSMVDISNDILKLLVNTFPKATLYTKRWNQKLLPKETQKTGPNL